MRNKRYGEPQIGEEAEGYTEGGRASSPPPPPPRKPPVPGDEMAVFPGGPHPVPDENGKMPSEEGYIAPKYAQGGRKRRRRGGSVASGSIARPRLDQRPRRTVNGAPAGKDLPAPAGDLGAPLPEAPQGTRPSTPISVDDDDPRMLKRGGRLTAAERHALPGKDFALPGERYPIPDASHGRNALARVSQFGNSEEKAKVRAAVHRKFPQID